MTGRFKFISIVASEKQKATCPSGNDLKLLSYVFFSVLLFVDDLSVVLRPCHPCEGRDPEDFVPSSLDARLRGHDEKSISSPR